MRAANPEDVLVRREGAQYIEEAARAGIIVPEFDEIVDRQAPETATVIAVGSDAARDVTPGQRVLISRYAGDEDFTVGGEEYTRAKLSEILAVVN